MKLLIFDLDGTILYTLEDLTDAVNYGLSSCGFSSRTIDEVRSFVGNGIKKLIERAVPEEASEQQIMEVYDRFTEYYSVHCKDKTRPYDGIVVALKALKTMGYRLAVVSNKADYGVLQLCKEFFDGIFEMAVGEKEGVRRKPYPDSVNLVLDNLGISVDDALYIGDSEVDIETAGNAKLSCISVTWGFRDKEFLIEKGAKHIAENPDQLIEIIKGK